MSKDYNESHVKILTGIESIRHNPEMYIDTIENPHRLFDEILDNAIDELDYSDSIDVIVNLDDNTYTVIDTGRGIPLGKKKYKDKEDYIPVLIATELFSSGKFDKKAYKMSAGLHGVGLVVVNALSEFMEIEVFRDGKHGIFIFKNSKLIESKISKCGKKYKDKRGTRITFKPDKNIFETDKIDLNYIKSRLEVINLYDNIFTNKNISLKVIKDGKIDIISIDDKNTILNKLLKSDKYFYVNSKSKTGEFIEIYFNYTEDRLKYGFVNVIPVHRGTHIKFSENIITKSINKYFKKNIDDIGEHFNIVVITRLINKRFQPQTKTRLVTPIKYINNLFEKSIYNKVKNIISSNEDIFKEILYNIERFNRKTIVSLSKSKKNKNKNVNKFNNLKDCIKHDKNSELIIVEGDSAGGMLSKLRDINYQAILQLHGKIINVANANENKIKNNRDIQALVNALGITPHSEDLSKLRYGKILLAADADPDGKHIIALLLTVFSHLYPSIIKNNLLYVVENPLYGIVNKKTKEFIPIYDFEELKKYNSNKYDKFRFKGLGAMDEEIYDIILNPKTRKLIKVTIENINDIIFITELMNKRINKHNSILSDSLIQ